jgi:MFS family permease
MEIKGITMKHFSWLNRTILALGFVSFFSDLGSEMATSILPAFIVSIGASAAFLGLIEGLADASNSFTSIAAGWGSDYVQSRKPFAAVGYLLASIGIAILSGARQGYQIIIGRVLTRIGKGVREPARDVLLVHAADRSVYGRIFGFHRMMDKLGGIFGPLIALFLVRVLPLNFIFLFAFVPVFISFLIVVFFVKEVRAKSHLNIQPEEIAVLPSLFKSYVVAVGIFGLGNCATSLLVLRAIDVIKLQIGSFHTNWYSIFFYMLHNILYALCAYPIGSSADFIGKRKVLILGYLFMGLGLLGFALGYNHIWYLVMLFVTVGIANAAIDALQRAVATDLLPRDIRATGYGTLGCVIGLGNLFSSIIVGVLWSSISPLVGFAYAALFCILGALLMARVSTIR